jgi:hypothetical protein
MVALNAPSFPALTFGLFYEIVRTTIKILDSYPVPYHREPQNHARSLQNTLEKVSEIRCNPDFKKSLLSCITRSKLSISENLIGFGLRFKGELWFYFAGIYQ